MNPVNFALRHPIAMLMLVVGLIAGGALAIFRMRIDIFPPFDLPQIYVIQNFNGMTPAQMEGLIVNQFELNFQYVDGVKSVESRSIQQIALIKLSFYPGTDMSQAMAEVVGQANRAQAFMPAGVLPPQIMRMDAGSFPVGYLVLTSQTESLGALADYAQQIVRPLLQTKVPGTVGTSPFGSNVRSIVLKIDPERVRSYNLTPDDIVAALMQGNVVTPAGNLYIKDQMPLVPMNTMISQIAEFGKIPLRQGRNVYVRDVATIEDVTDINFGYALVNGRRSIYVPVVKHNTASTLTVVADIHRALPIFSDALPESVKISYEFDESPTVKESIKSVAIEGLIGATLTGLMILLFLHDWRSVVVVVFNIPMALLSSLCALWITGGTINIMTLGGLALSIGMLVDEATVSIENIHVQMGHTGSLARAVERGSNETAVPRLLAMLCILSVFIPAFIMAEPVRSLFVPLALAVGFAMIASYILSSTVVPVLSVWLLKHHGHRVEEATPGQEKSQAANQGLFERLQTRFGRAVGWVVAWRWIVTPLYLSTCLLVLVVLGLQLGTELFPQVDAGEFVLRFRAPPGTNFELTREMWVKCLEVIDEEAGADHIHISMGFAGQQAPNYGVNNMILFMRGPDDGQMRVQLTDGSGIKLGPFQERLRKVLPERVVPWFAEVLEREGHSPAVARQRAQQIVFGFEPGDVVSEVMSFGAPTPIEITAASPNLDNAETYARKVEQEFRKIPYLRDVQIQQTLDYPTVPITIDRQKAGLSGVTTKQIGDSILVATSSSRMVARNYWQDPRTGVSYQVQVEVPTQRMNSAAEAETIPLDEVNPGLNLMVRDVARVGS
ncbi:MAG TPA: efflux RND transporter permease subunit, partial [Pirellulales bacterium]|nr:efflux RND transporter permease subunit [Pirellulales bacterium]